MLMPQFNQFNFIFIDRDPTALPLYEDRNTVNKISRILKDTNQTFALSGTIFNNDICLSVSKNILDMFPIDKFLTESTNIDRYGIWNGYVLTHADSEAKCNQDIYNQLALEDLTFLKLSHHTSKNIDTFIYQLKIDKCEVVENAKRPLHNYLKDSTWLRGLSRGGIDSVLFKTEDGKNVLYILNEKCIERIIRLDLIGYTRVI